MWILFLVLVIVLGGVGIGMWSYGKNKKESNLSDDFVIVEDK